ncbi:MAG: SAM-dependent methyltransferase [Acidaminobacteraceae bacterium]
MSEIRELISEVILKENFISGVFSSVRKTSETDYKKVIVKSVLIKEEKFYQFEYFMNDNKVIHENNTYEQLVGKFKEFVEKTFKQVMLFTDERDVQILISKKGKMTIKNKKATKEYTGELSHNRVKNYILKEGSPYDFLIKLNICDENGKVYKKKFDKFKQLNKYLEFVSGAVSSFKDDKEITIVDFGCGKAYLTFALYHYLVNELKLNVNIVGLDLKKDVIEYCSEVASELGYSKLKFQVGDIRDYNSDVDVSMVVSLHACDIATDIALAKSVSWNAKVIFAVPCCQHEMFDKVRSKSLSPMLKHGIVKEKLSSLITDSVRGLKLESLGYEVNMMEFIDMEHTPKNILIKAIREELSDLEADTLESRNHKYESFKRQFGLEKTFIDEAFDTY